MCNPPPSLSSLCLRLPSELPGPPSNMAISNIGPRSVTLQFKPGYDGKTSISRWQVEAQVRPLPAEPSYPLGCLKGAMMENYGREVLLSEVY